MRKLARWHTWIGWLAGVPLLMWCLSGLVMVARPIDEVRGAHLRRTLPAEPLPPGLVFTAPAVTGPVAEMTTAMELGRPVTRVTYTDKRVERFGADGRPLPPLSERDVRRIVGREIVGGDRVGGARLFDAAHPPADFREPRAIWQVNLTDGTRVYVDPLTGAISAVRTKWWRLYDVFWGLHIMDLETRENSHHPVLIGFAALALLTSLIGMVLLFRRRGRVDRPGSSTGR